MADKKNTKSKVQQLPEHIKTELNALIRSGAVSQKEMLAQVNALIEAAGLPDEDKLSRSGLNRYSLRMEQTGSRILAARETAEVWTAKLGQAPTSELGKMLQEFVRTMAFETSMKLMDDPDKVVDPKALGQLALVVQRIEAAAMSSHKVEKEIRAAALEEAAAAAEKLSTKAGLSADRAAEIRRGILGIQS